MSGRSPQSMPWRAFVLLALPFAAFVLILFRTSTNVPYMDDYDEVLAFLNTYLGLHGVQARLWWLLTEQHNEYKLIFLHAIVALEYRVSGNVNFALLGWLGDLFVPFIVILLWILLARSGRSTYERAWLFAPVCFLMFSMQYCETLNWAMGGLQNLTTLAFALLALMLVDRSGRAALAGACLALALSDACSASGFFAGISGAALLALQARWRRLAAWSATTIAMAALYSVHYKPWSVGPALPLRETVLYLLVTPLEFLGVAIDHYWLFMGSGICMAGLVVVLIRQGWHRRDSTGFSIALFIVMTAVAVGHARYREGITAGTAPRYRIYSLLLISVMYIATLRMYAPENLLLRPAWRRVLLAVTALTVLFCAAADTIAAKNLTARKELLLTHLIEWQRHPASGKLVPDEDAFMQTPQWVEFQARATKIMRRSFATGIYLPPVSAESEEPIHLNEGRRMRPPLADRDLNR